MEKFYTRNDWKFISKIAKNVWKMPSLTNAHTKNIIEYITRESLKKDPNSKINFKITLEGNDYYEWYYHEKINTLIFRPFKTVQILPSGTFGLEEDN